MSELFLETRPSNPLRPPDWRWLRGVYLASNPDKLKYNHDPLVLVARNIYGAIDMCEDMDYMIFVSSDYPVEYDAWELYKRPKYEAARAEVEARLMADEHIDSIAQKTNRHPNVIKLYATLFFDVFDRLGAPSAVQNAVFPTQMREGFRAADFPGLWKLMGYWAGPTVLDHVIWPLASSEATATASTFYEEHYRATLGCKALMAAMCTRINTYTEANIMDAYTRVRDLEKFEDRGSIGQAQIVNNLAVMYQHMPWEKAYVAQQRAKEDPVITLDQRSTGLRAHELANASVSPEYRVTMSAIMDSAELVPFN